MSLEQENERLKAEVLKHIERVAFLERELADATKAGTPFWKERDTLNSYVVENARLREALGKILGYSCGNEAIEDFAREALEQTRQGDDK